MLLHFSYINTVDNVPLLYMKGVASSSLFINQDMKGEESNYISASIFC